MLAQVSTLTIDSIPGGRAAVAAIIGKVSEFQRIPGRLAIVGGIINKIAAKGSTYQVTLLQQSLAGLQADYAATSGQVADVLTQLHTAGYADATIDLVLATAKAGANVLAMLSRTKTLEEQAAQVAGLAGVPVSVLASLSASPIAKVAVIGAVLYGLYTVATGKGGRRHF